MLNQNEIKTQDLVSDYYEEVRYQRPQSWEYQSWWFKKMIKLVSPTGLILDDGGGTGHLAEFLKDNRIINLDVSMGMLKHAQKRMNLLVAGDAQHLPFKNDIFDTVFARSMLHHLPVPEEGVREITRVLKSGGQVVFCDTLYSFLSALPRRLANKTEHFSEEHKNLREKEIIALIEPYLKITKIHYFGYIAYPLLGFPDVYDFFKFIPNFLKIPLAEMLIKLDELIAMIPLLNKQAWGIMVVAEKR